MKKACFCLSGDEDWTESSMQLAKSTGPTLWLYLAEILAKTLQALTFPSPTNSSKASKCQQCSGWPREGT